MTFSAGGEFIPAQAALMNSLVTSRFVTSPPPVVKPQPTPDQ